MTCSGKMITSFLEPRECACLQMLGVALSWLGVGEVGLGTKLQGLRSEEQVISNTPLRGWEFVFISISIS